MYKRTLLALIVGLGLSACTNSPANLPPGHYSSSTKSTDAAGTTYKKSTETDVEVDRYGNKSATSETETTTDPKGLFNKSTTKSTTTYK